MKKRLISVVALLSCFSLFLTGCYSALGEADLKYIDDKFTSLFEDGGKKLSVEIGVQMDNVADTADKYVSEYPYGLPMTDKNDAIEPQNVISFKILSTDDVNEIVYVYQTLQYKPIAEIPEDNGTVTISTNSISKETIDEYSLKIESSKGREVTNSMRTVIAVYSLATKKAKEIWADTKTVTAENLKDVTGKTVTLMQYMSSVNFFAYPYYSTDSTGKCTLNCYALLYGTTVYLIQKEGTQYHTTYQRDISDLLTSAYNEKKQPEVGCISSYDITSFAILGNKSDELEFQVGMAITNKEITDTDDTDGESISGVKDYIINISTQLLGTIQAIGIDNNVEGRVKRFRELMDNDDDKNFLNAANGANTDTNYPVDLEEIYLISDPYLYIKAESGTTIIDSALRRSDIAAFMSGKNVLMDGSGYKYKNKECSISASSVFQYGTNIQYENYKVDDITYIYSTYSSYMFVMTNATTTNYSIEEDDDQESFYSFSNEVMFSTNGDTLTVYKHSDSRKLKGNNIKKIDDISFDSDIRSAEARYQNGRMEILVQDKDNLYLVACTYSAGSYDLNEIFRASLLCLYYPNNLETTSVDQNSIKYNEASDDIYNSITDANKGADYTKYNSVSLNEIKQNNSETYSEATGEVDATDDDIMKLRNPDSYSIFGVRCIDNKYYICSMSSGLINIICEPFGKIAIACEQVSRYPCFMFAGNNTNPYIYGFDNYKNIYNIKDKARSRIISMDNFYTQNNTLVWRDLTK